MKGDFLLNTELSKRLYRECAAGLPVIDYHNHLSLQDLEQNRRFENLYELWIQPDPYKHRAMRMCGVPESHITGDAPAEEKFRAWCTIFPRLAGNPLYQWSLMELQDVLEIREIPNSVNWKELWNRSAAYMSRNPVSVKRLFDKYRVEYASPCTALTDNLTIYEGKKDLAPSLRGDTIVRPTNVFIESLKEQTKVPIGSLAEYKKAVSVRLKVFADAGCRFADHALDNQFCYCKEDGKNEQRFQKILQGEVLGKKDEEQLASALLLFLGGEYARFSMVMQLHMGAQRSTSTRLYRCAGAAGGYACIGNSVDVDSLTRMLDEIEQTGKGLPRVILFSLNPSDHAMLSSLSGSYSRDGVAGLVTQGPAWWWCDHNFGIRSLLENTAAYGLLSNFVGMTTDSRSFLSFVRHDYFRRILCDWLAMHARTQELPESPELLKKLVYEMCYGNAKRILEEG